MRPVAGRAIPSHPLSRSLTSTSHLPYHPLVPRPPRSLGVQEVAQEEEEGPDSVTPRDFVNDEKVGGRGAQAAWWLHGQACVRA